MSDLLSLEGRVALITGAGQGVGRQVGLHFARHGARAVIINDYFAERAEQTAREIRELGGQAHAFQADVTDAAAVKAMVERATDLAGPIDILVNNAGNLGAEPTEAARAPFWESGQAGWEPTLLVNFHGVVHCTSAVLPAMIERRRGRVITIISDAGRMGEAGVEVYSGAKAGAAGFMRALARSMGRHEITANCVAIAATATPTVKPRLEEDPVRLKKILEKYVIRRVGEPDDVANMVLFLASDASSWITGQTYPVNGGFSFAL